MRQIFIALLLTFAAPGWGIEVPFLSGPVVDEAGLLTPTEKASLEARVQAVNASEKAQLVVYLAKSLQGEEIEPFSIKVAEQWKLGRKGKDEGLIFLVVPSERRMRIEVGYGLEGEIPDVIAKRILDDVVAPFFRAGRLQEGLPAGVAALGDRLGVSLERPSPPARRRQGTPQIPLFLVLFLVVFLLQAFTGVGRGRGRRRWDHFGGGGGFGGGGFGGGGFGGGGFGGGGGGFGGGGSSSRW